MQAGRSKTRVGCSLIGALAVVGFSAHAEAHDHEALTSQDHASASDKGQNGALVEVVREATERFRDVSVAEAEGYHLLFGCVSGGDFGAMGLHFVNTALIGDDIIDPRHPEIVLYEPTSDGGVRLTGADFLVLKDVWDAKHAAPPELMGQLFHLFDAPNRFGLPPFYTLHVWAWKDNPNGSFVNWNPRVSCDEFGGEGGK